tara:strand:+ start:187 stop:432 length:246 start_codon:yes stop_codon:yes gene_type:complete
MPNMKQSGVQPTPQDYLNPSPKVSGGVNNIYNPPVSKVASTSIYLTDSQAVGGGANSVQHPEAPRVAGGANDIYLRDNESV